jgi:hypothetical protein
VNYSVAWLALLATATAGCGLQATVGRGGTAQRPAAWVGNVGLDAQAQRTSGASAGLRTGMLIDHGLVVKNAVLHGGYDTLVVPGWLTLEPGVDLGAGQPAIHVFRGVGAYGGLAGTARLRFVTGDREPNYNVLFPFVELVLLPRGGIWLPPEGAGSTAAYFDWSVELGIRLGLGSDIISPRQGQIPEDHSTDAQAGGGLR